MEWNLDNCTVINQFKLCTANDQAVYIDNANRKRGYELRNSVFPEYKTYISILLTICITVIFTPYRINKQFVN